MTTTTFIVEWAISHTAYPEVTLKSTASVDAAERAAAKGLVTCDYQPDGSVRVTLTDAGQRYARDAFDPEGYQWLTEHCACRTPHTR